jgi:hypothetical protein
VINNQQGERSRGYIPFTTLEITNGIWEDKTVACADRFNNTAGYVILSAAGVCLIHCMELGTAALNLESI